MFAALPVVALALALLAPVLAPASPAAAADGASWSVGPADNTLGQSRPNFDYALEAGAVLEDAFLVRNNGATDLTLTIYAADAFTTREGNIDLLAAGEESVDAGTWVDLGVNTVTLTPGEESTIPFTVTVPADARPGDHSAGIVASLTSNDPAAQVQVDRRLGSRMYIRLAGDLVPAVEATDLSVDFTGSWNPLAIGSLDVSYRLENLGNTRVTALSALDAAGPLGAASIASGDVQLPEVLPGSDIVVSHQLTGVGALLWLSGAVDIRPSSVGLGAAQLEAIELPFSIPAVPITVLLVVLVLALVIVAVVLVIRRRRGATSATAPAAVPGS